jgi:hypothetical protein
MEELEYKGDKIVKYGENDYVGFYLNADDEVNTTYHCKTLKEAQKALDKYNKLVSIIKNEKGE